MYQEKAKHNLTSIIFMMLVITSCTINKPISKTNMSQQIYYTQEGKPYVLKCHNQLVDANEVIPAGAVSPIVSFSQQPVTTPLPLWIAVSIQADKPVVPLMLYYNIQGLAPVLGIAQIATPYCGRSINSGFFDPTFMKTISKIIALADLRYRDAVAPNEFVEYSLRYNQIVLANEDFIDINPNAIFVYGSNMGNAFKTSTNNITLAASPNARVSVSVLYFQFL